MKTLLRHRDILITRDPQTLVIANRRIRRELDLSCSAPRTISLCDGEEMEFADRAKPDADFAFLAMTPPGFREDISWTISEIRAQWNPDTCLDSGCASVILTMREEVSQTVYIREYRIYPDFPAIAVQTTLAASVMPNLFWTARGGLNTKSYLPDVRESTADSIRPAAGILPRQTVEFVGRTDENDDLVLEHPLEQSEANGNLLFCADSGGAGFLFLQEAPPSGERRDPEPYDFRIRGEVVCSCNWGIHPSDIRPGKSFRGYRHVLLVYHSETERNRLLKEYLKKRFPPKPYSVMVNPWGCGRFPSLVNEAFLQEEMRAAQEVGATHYQIDDAWQEGGSLAEIAVKNRLVTADFWNISRERLNGTFDPVMEAAANAGIRPGLWMAPSCNCEYRDWNPFAERILELHRRYGFRIFKIDAVMLRTYEAEDNLRNLLEYVRTVSGGEISFNLDTTAGQRSGYFLFLEYGSIFLENRYVCHEWGLGYHPEKTLRSLWNLAKYMRPQELQIEVPYAGDINDKFYADKPWCSPRSYPQEYWAAVALFANPLLWFAPSTVKPEDRPGIRSVMELHKRYRDAVFAGEIYPVGLPPDGASITGFHSCGAEHGREFLILYREFRSSRDTTEIRLEQGGASQWEILGGTGNLLRSERNSITLQLPECASYLFLGSKPVIN